MKLKKALKSKSLELDDLVELENELLLSSFDVETNDNNDQKTQSGTEDNDLILFVTPPIPCQFSNYMKYILFLLTMGVSPSLCVWLSLYDDKS
jgi:hypothetical protein